MWGRLLLLSSNLGPAPLLTVCQYYLSTITTISVVPYQRSSSPSRQSHHFIIANLFKVITSTLTSTQLIINLALDIKFTLSHLLRIANPLLQAQTILCHSHTTVSASTPNPPGSPFFFVFELKHSPPVATWVVSRPLFLDRQLQLSYDHRPGYPFHP